MTIEEVFYVLAIVYFVAWILFLLGILIVLVVLRKKVKELKKSIEERKVPANLIKNLLTYTPLLGFVSALPILKKFLRYFRR